MRNRALLLSLAALCVCSETAADVGMPFVDLSVTLEGQPIGNHDVMVMHYPDIGEKDAATLSSSHAINSFLVKSCSLEEGRCLIPTKPAEGARRQADRKQAIEIYLVNRPLGAEGNSKLGYASWTGASYPDAIEIYCSLKSPASDQELAATECDIDGI